jgi:hypothetical protein
LNIHIFISRLGMVTMEPDIKIENSQRFPAVRNEGGKNCIGGGNDLLENQVP